MARMKQTARRSCQPSKAQRPKVQPPKTPTPKTQPPKTQPPKAPPPPPPPSSYLLKITLIKTASPLVTRLLSVPCTLHFSELHLALAAAFNWTSPCHSWLFRLWTSDPLKHSEQPQKHTSTTACYSTTPTSGSNTQPPTLNASTALSVFFRKEGAGKFWTYDYDISRFHHAIEVVGTSPAEEQEEGRLCCLGGQGQIGMRAWQFADLEGVDGVVVWARSTWDLDTGGLNARLEVVQEGFEKRKAADDEAEMKRKQDEAAARAAKAKKKVAVPKVVVKKTAAPTKARKPIKPKETVAVKTVAAKTLTTTVPQTVPPTPIPAAAVAAAPKPLPTALPPKTPPTTTAPPKTAPTMPPPKVASAATPPATATVKVTLKTAPPKAAPAKNTPPRPTLPKRKASIKEEAEHTRKKMKLEDLPVKKEKS